MKFKKKYKVTKLYSVTRRIFYKMNGNKWIQIAEDKRGDTLYVEEGGFIGGMWYKEEFLDFNFHPKPEDIRIEYSFNVEKKRVYK
jgi:hypothetical protein